MPVFLSYSRQDLVLAGKLAERLKAAGIEVWWDQAIVGGETYDSVTETALRKARCVLVLWTPTSVGSRWVRSEATVALQHETLLPVMLTECQRPVMFELCQSRDLIGWKGNARDPRLKALIADVNQMIAAAPVRRSGAAPFVPATPAAAVAGPLSTRRRVIGGGIAAAIVAGGGLAWWRLRGQADAPGPAGNPDAIASIIVMPFESATGDADQAWFASGVAEEVRSTLTQLPGLKVIGRMSSERLRNAADIGAAAAQMGAGTILTGSVRRGGDTVRILVQLMNAQSGIVLWSQGYDRPAGDVLAIQREIAAAVATALRYRVDSEGIGERLGGTRNAQANELYLHARESVVDIGDEAGQLEKLALYDRALAADPSFALAWATRAVPLDYLSRISVTDLARRRQLFAEATASAERAIRLVPKLGYAHAVLANQHAARLDMTAATREADMAIRLASRDAPTLAIAGLLLALVHPERGLDIMQASLVQDPFDAINMANMGGVLYKLGRLDAATAMFENAISLSNGVVGHPGLATVQLLRGIVPDRGSVTRVTEDARKLFVLAALDRMEGLTPATSSARRKLEALDPAVSGFYLARLQAWSGERAAALDTLDRAYAAVCRELQGILGDPFLDSLADEPRFQALLARIFPADAVAAARRRVELRVKNKAPA